MWLKSRQSAQHGTYTVGRITGSNFHRVAKCMDSSVESIVKQLMQYESTKLTVLVVTWGRQMEDTARQCYLTEMKKIHMNWSSMVKADEPYLAASPAGVFTCGCYGTGVLEIKRPFKHKEALEGSGCDASFCILTKTIICNLPTRITHRFIYRCVFVKWTFVICESSCRNNHRYHLWYLWSLGSQHFTGISPT